MERVTHEGLDLDTRLLGIGIQVKKNLEGIWPKVEFRDLYATQHGYIPSRSPRLFTSTSEN